jgi:class 3 adenylate cyclase
MKFVGDALLVAFFPRSESETQADLARRAIQAASGIQEELHDAVLDDGVTLAVKCGVGCGIASLVHVGNGDRVEYVTTGPPLFQAFECEAQCLSGQVVISPEAIFLIREEEDKSCICSRGGDDCKCGKTIIETELLPNGGSRLVKIVQIVRMVHVATSTMSELLASDTGGDNLLENDDRMLSELLKYIPRHARVFMDRSGIDQSVNRGSLRLFSVVFVDLQMQRRAQVGMASSKQNQQKLQNAVNAILCVLDQYRGDLNKVMMDDKGMLVVCVFGLPPSKSDDALRALLAAIEIKAALEMGPHHLKPKVKK